MGSPGLELAVTHLLARTYLISEDLAEDLKGLLQEVEESPMAREELEALLRKILDRLRESAIARGDGEAVEALSADTEELVQEALAVVDQRQESAPVRSREPFRTRGNTVHLLNLNGVDPGPVRPTPVFRGRSVPMLAGYVKTSDIDLWEGNVRLEVHIQQFERTHGRRPTSEELLDIMLSHVELPGVREENEFKIPELARSIALNGVQRPPIIGLDGTLYDGNRRMTACYYILNSDEFTPDQKQRGDKVFVWQLTEHATQEDIDAVVVALNFEPDHKQAWPTYVKARRVADEWATMLVLQGRASPQRIAELKRELSQRFGLGPDTNVVNRWLRMIDWANDFEDYHVQERDRDQFEVKHRAADAFEYFDELSKGNKAGGVAWSLNQDEPFKHLVFDLLFDAKFRNWSQIRNLKYVADDRDAQDALRRARDEKDIEDAQEHLENAMALARQRKAEERELGANTKIDRFVTWLEELPVRTFRDTISRDNLRRLLQALRLVEKQAASILDEETHGP